MWTALEMGGIGVEKLIIDCFAGGGGASVGIEMVLGRPVDIAINHDPDAILMHKTNHTGERTPRLWVDDSEGKLKFA